MDFIIFNIRLKLILKVEIIKIWCELVELIAHPVTTKKIQTIPIINPTTKMEMKSYGCYQGSPYTSFSSSDTDDDILEQPLDDIIGDILKWKNKTSEEKVEFERISNELLINFTNYFNELEPYSDEMYNLISETLIFYCFRYIIIYHILHYNNMNESLKNIYNLIKICLSSNIYKERHHYKNIHNYNRFFLWLDKEKST